MPKKKTLCDYFQQGARITCQSAGERSSKYALNEDFTQEEHKAVDRWKTEKSYLDKEFPNEGNYYELNVTFKDKMLDNCSEYDLYNSVRERMDKFKRTEHGKGIYCSYIMVPEWAPETLRFHLHGILYFHDSGNYIFNAMKKSLRTKFGRTTGAEIKNMSKWTEYITKDIGKNGRGKIIAFVGVIPDYLKKNNFKVIYRKKSNLDDIV